MEYIALEIKTAKTVYNEAVCAGWGLALLGYRMGEHIQAGLNSSSGAVF
jgi:hypothetical protein